MHKKIKEYRIVSITTLGYLGYEMNRFLSWVMSTSPESVGEGIAITGILSAMAAMFKFVFEFAVSDSEKSKD